MLYLCIDKHNTFTSYMEHLYTRCDLSDFRKKYDSDNYQIKEVAVFSSLFKELFVNE